MNQSVVIGEIVPVVTIVVEGGKDTITNIYYDLRDNIPVLIIDVTTKYPQYPYEIGEINKAPSVTAFSRTSDNTNSSKIGIHTYFEVQLDASRNTLKGIFEKYDERLRKDLDLLISHDDDLSKGKKSNDISNHTPKDAKSNKFGEILRQVMYCLQPAVRSGIAVFNLNSDDNLSETIFRTVCKSHQKYLERKENNQYDLSEQHERNSKPPTTVDTKRHHADSQRSQLLQLAMDWNCADVAKELILQNSLDNILNSDKTQLNAFIESNDVVGKHIRTTEELNDYRSSWGLMVQIQTNPRNFDQHDKANKEIVFDYIMRDLFIWAILMNHTEMAQVFLSHMKYRICAALIATKILKEYFHGTAYADLKDTYEKNAKYFEEYAIACQIVLQRIELYGNVTCLQVAADAQDKLFIATPCCAQAINNIWCHNIHPKQSNKRKEIAMAIAIFSLGLLAPPFVKY
ncbi:unnamed protein product [Adineta steineri]|uniref:TRPM-like domain-containing protein n=1 Tax=Adineta steineri TaxID=433720 RepID=A0A814QNS8_9BILA|nr:unnamed protein product [Adineta steineri]CAF1122171.1 unnamed protein product [Adineta steineri]CAF1289061.1 unnamed protein product [Adineta steineri]